MKTKHKKCEHYGCRNKVEDGGFKFCLGCELEFLRMNEREQNSVRRKGIFRETLFQKTMRKKRELIQHGCLVARGDNQYTDPRNGNILQFKIINNDLALKVMAPEPS